MSAGGQKLFTDVAFNPSNAEVTFIESICLNPVMLEFIDKLSPSGFSHFHDYFSSQKQSDDHSELF